MERYPNRNPSVRLKLFGLALVVTLASPAWALGIFATGNSQDVTPATTPVMCLAGGGGDDRWADGWRYALAHAGGGDIVVIRADGKRGGYETWIYDDESGHGFPKVNSVRTILLEKAEDANDPEVERQVLNAELVFFAGGFQELYIDWIRGSRLERALEHVMNVKKIPMAGSSAGMVFLGGIAFTARYDSPAQPGEKVSTTDVLRDPTGKFVDLDRSVLTPPLLKNVVMETHMSERDRQGRVVGFMARAVHDGLADLSEIKGIGADEGTATCFDENGVARVFGTGKMVFLQANAPVENLAPGAPLHWSGNHRAVRAYVIPGSNAGASFDLKSWNGTGGTEQYWWIDSKHASHADAEPLLRIN